ncbi:MAG TPA: GAF domain-containing protein [Thermoanaerobaculia bacterium]|nr:GAF domain-containing protein [Thermoanaerobaculia bacterium]
MPTKPVVLTVESEQREAHSLASAVADPSWTVISAPDAQNAIQAAREVKPAVIVISSRVLGGGGAVVLRRLRLSAHTATIPVIGVTGAGMRDAILEAGAQVTLPERCSPAELREVVAGHVARRPIVLEAPVEVLQNPARLAALQRTKLLDSGPDETFDRVNRIAARLLGVPAMLVSLVDHDRQYFKSQIGLPEPFASHRQSPLTHSFCQWVVSSGENLVIGDAREHETLRENRATHEMNVVAYAGALLSSEEGEAIGSLCAIDSAPREWNETELATLNDLRDVAQTYVHLHAAPPAGPDQHQSVGNAIAAAARVLSRPNGRVTEDVRTDVIGLLNDLSRHLVQK